MASGGNAAEQHQPIGIGRWRRRRAGGAEGGAVEVEQPVAELQLFNADQGIRAVLAAVVRDGGDPGQGVIAEAVSAAGSGVDSRIGIRSAIEPVIAGITLQLIVATAAIQLVLASAGHDNVITARRIGDVVAGLEVEEFALAGTGAGVITAGAPSAGVDHPGARRGAGREVGDEDAGIKDVIASIGNTDLDRIGLTSQDRRNNLERMTDAVVFNRQQISAVVVLKISRRQVGADHTQRRIRIMVEQGIVDPIHDHHRRIDKGIDPLGVFIGAEDQIKAD